MRMYRLLIALSLLWLLASPLSAREPATEVVRVMTFNIHHGEGVDGRLDIPRIAEIIRAQKADLVALQEVDRGTLRTGDRDLAAELAALTGFNYVFGKNLDFQGGEYGNAILSRFPIEQSRNLHYARVGNSEQRGLLQAIIAIAGRQVVFMSTHLDHRPDDAERFMSIDQIREAADDYGHLALILAGDFNDVPGSRVHSKIKQSFRDAWEVGDQEGFTFAADRPHKRIDYVWLSAHQDVKPLKAWVVPTDASDHLPLVVECLLQIHEPIVIAHRGSSGHRPEHTEAAYSLAVEQGADFIEADVVLTGDGVLIARHENELSKTTDVAQRREFADRKTTKEVDRVKVTGWFSEDFTLAEIKTLRAKERIPEIRPANRAFDGKYQVPTLADVIRLAKRESARTGRRVGLYVETKHPTYFATEGRYLNGSLIGRSLGQVLVRTLVDEGFTESERVYIQSFEAQNLLELRKSIMPAAGVNFPLIQLYAGLSGSSRPYDVVFNVSIGADLAAIYPGLGRILNLTRQASYADFATREVLRWMAGHYAAGIGPSKDSLLVRRRIEIPGGQEPSNGAATQLTGEVHPLLERARSLGLEVHPYTLRAERVFQTLGEGGRRLTLIEEAVRLLQLGATGFFTDQPEKGVAAREQFLRDTRPGSGNH
jgi:glycerophosphoryl diester phosphodiesterase